MILASPSEVICSWSACIQEICGVGISEILWVPSIYIYIYIYITMSNNSITEICPHPKKSKLL